ncbi:MAG TPA: DUF4397 domain-containing protein [Streptosporangiaceae bacterium]
MNGKAAIARAFRLLALAVLALGLVSGVAPASASAGAGWLRLAHLSPNTPAVDVYLYSFHNSKALIIVHHVAYGTISGYQKIPAGEYTVAMRAAGAPASSSPVISTSVNIKPGRAYTVAGMGPAKGLRLQVLHDRLTTPKGKVLVRIIQASLREHRVTIRADHTVIARNVAFASVTSYKAVKPGDWNVSAAGPTDRTSSNITLAAGTIHTIVVLDDPGHLFLDDLVDAAGSKVAPGGGPATGFGGTAPRPGHSELPWVALVGAGLLIGVAGFRKARKPIGAHAMSGRGPSAAA